MSVNVQFALQVEAGNYLPETKFDESAQTIDAIAALPRAPFGRLTIESIGKTTLTFFDDVAPMVSGLEQCLQELRETGRGDLDSFTQPFTWELERKGETVVVASEDEATVDYPAQEFEQALQACYERLMELSKKFPNLTSVPDDSDESE